jgi:glycosyltransferase involved in cell wall biosynthesis
VNVRAALNLTFLEPGEMGGLEVYARELTAALATRDDVSLVLLLNRRAGGDPAWRELGETVVLDMDPARRVEWVRADQTRVPRAARNAKADVVHSLASTSPLRGALPRVVTVHDLNYLVHPDAHFGLRALGMRALVPLAVRRAARVIVPSAATRDDLVTRLRADPARIDVVPEGVGQSRSAPGTLPEPVARALEARPRPLLLSVSAKRPHKNLGRLIGAVARLPDERRPLLVLPGYPTPHERELESQAHVAGIAGDVVFLGFVSAAELEALYGAATAVVLPSLYEGFGLPVLEAMARGVPVATSGRASLAEVAGDAALTFDPEDEASIAEAVERMLVDAGLRARLSEAGRERARGFTWERAAELTVASYRRALAER